MENTYKITTHSDDETIEVAQNLEAEKFPNMVICLNGDLGSGKTVFTKGFASAMSIEEVTSPTFNIIKEYEGELPMYHMDVYRTNGKVDELGIEEYFEKKGAIVVLLWGGNELDFHPVRPSVCHDFHLRKRGIVVVNRARTSSLFFGFFA